MATSDTGRRKHTPGPWHFQVSPCGHSGNIFNLGVTSAYHLGTFTSGSKREVGTFLDNARLIAAAPELLAMLETAFDILERIAEVLLYEGGVPVTALDAREIETIYADAISELAPIETLIRKARGQS
jgi:hypothetical protein